MKVYKNLDNAIIFGVCAGLGEAFGAGPLFSRVLFLIAMFFAPGWLIGGYLVCVLILPPKPPSPVEISDGVVIDIVSDLQIISDQLIAVEKRVGQIEHYVTSDDFALKRQIRSLQDE